jgi:hypothetical protein
LQHFATAGIAWLGALAVREHRAAIAARAGLLDALLPHFTQVKVEVAPDGFRRSPVGCRTGVRFSSNSFPTLLSCAGFLSSGFA